MVAIDLVHVWHEILWLVAAQVDSHVNLLLQVVLALAGPRSLKTSFGVLLEKCKLLFLLATTHFVLAVSDEE